MTKRKGIGPKLRFEVFKRDKFICQYCGESSPKVVLHVDHINPVSKGGTNDILNLVTSCVDCNIGKSNRELSDSSVIEKQKKQLDDLQERREQIALMFEWRKELDAIDSHTVDLISEYIESKIEGFRLSDDYLKKLEKLNKKFELTSILDAVDKSEHQYLRIGGDGELLQESVEQFLTKMPNILANVNRPPLEQKKAYILGICRNRFRYFDVQRNAVLLNNLEKALRASGCSDDYILDFFSDGVMNKAKEVTNWTQWKGAIEATIEKYNQNKQAFDDHVVSKESLDVYVNKVCQGVWMVLPSLMHIVSAFPEKVHDRYVENFKSAVLNYFTDLHEYYSESEEDREKKPTLSSNFKNIGLYDPFRPDDKGLKEDLFHSFFHLANDFIPMVDDFLENPILTADDYQYIATKYHQIMFIGE